MKITQPHPDLLLEQLRLFNQAAQALTRQWSLTEDDGNHPIVMADKYPFDESFDQIAHQIHEWYEAAVNYQSTDYESLLATRASQYNTTSEVVERATKAFWSTDSDSQTESNCREAQAAGASTLEEFIKYFALKETR
ncbi:MAG: hypothetical protein LC794_03480 [Acidobacteria bacterium]|nr:hypothetical protein [Acidobacteriota bacterium]